MSQEELEIKASIWCQAINESAFCGQPSRYEDDYESLLTELGKLESIHGEECDWQEVRRAADALTREKSKDMQVLGALCAAELKLSGPSGLAPALCAYRLLLSEHSKEMFPNAARRRGRAGAYGWLVKYMQAHFEGFMPLPEDYDSLKESLDQFRGLDDLLRAELEDEHPGSKATLQLLSEKVAAVAPPEEAAPQAEEAASADDMGGAAATQASTTALAPHDATTGANLAVPARVGTEESAHATLGAALGALTKVADYFVGTSERQLLGHHLRHTVTLLQDASFGERPQPLQQLIEQAGAVASREGLERGCTILQDALKNAGTPEERFRLRLALAEICVDNRAADLARPILKDLHEEVKTPVHDWLPDLYVSLAGATLGCNRQLVDNGSLNPQKQQEANKESSEMMTVLSRLAPSVASRLRDLAGGSDD